MTGENQGFFLKLKNISKRFGENKVFENLSLFVKKGETVVIFGDRGAGKTVLLKIIATLLKFDSGEYVFDGVRVSFDSEEKLKNIRKKIGLSFQNAGLLSFFDVFHNLFMGDKEKLNQENSKIVAKQVLKQFELEHTLHLFPDQLSGGMQKRVSIARVFVKKPSLALFDDPLSGLDPVTSEKIAGLIIDFLKKSGATGIISGQDMSNLKIFKGTWYRINNKRLVLIK